MAMRPSRLWYQAPRCPGQPAARPWCSPSRSPLHKAWAWSAGQAGRPCMATAPVQQHATAAQVAWMVVRPAMASLASEWQQPFSGYDMLHHQQSQTEPASIMAACCMSSHQLQTMPATAAAPCMLQACKATGGLHPPCCGHLPVPAVGFKAVLVHKLWVRTCAHHQPPQGVLHGG